MELLMQLVGFSVLLAVCMYAVRHVHCVSNTYASVQEGLK